MVESLSPNPSAVQKQRRAMASQIQSPTSPFFLGSNDDNLERAQARAARAAAIRRRNTAVNVPPPSDDMGQCLGKQQILDLFHNCIKLASENKINQKNTWELKLIDHLTEIIKAEEEDDTETNFQKASCTLEAGVKIYSLRVDSVHSEAYKVLGGMNRAGQENEQDMSDDSSISETTIPEDNLESEKGGQSKKDNDRKLSPLSTLESSFEALNVKKFDVAFAIDPLYHQTSAQFDEGGAKGLLMNNLGIYNGCRVLFDSEEIPGKPRAVEERCDNSDKIDISFARECETMVLNIRVTDEISPTLRHIVNLFNDDNRRPSDFSRHKSTEEFQKACVDNSQFDGVTCDNFESWHYDHDEQTSAVDDGPYDGDSSFPSYNEENGTFTSHDPDADDRFERVDEYLFLSLGLPSKRNAWAGPDHWKYKKLKASEIDPATENVSQMATKKPRSKKQAESDINFTKSLEIEIPDLFAPPRNPRSLLLPKNRLACNTKLPEDCHYQPEDLVKLFLLPNVKCLGRRRKKFPDESTENYDDHEPISSWDDDHVFGGQFDDGTIQSDVEDSSTLVTQPRQVNKIEVQYDKTSKQVDVQALKDTLWDRMHESLTTSKGEEGSLSFKQILAEFPPDCRAVEAISDISPHLCFICLLHLANEHGLSIHGCANLNDLSIHLPR